MDRHFEAVVELVSDRFSPDSDAWRKQTEPLIAELGRHGFSLRKEQSAVAGQRGAVAETILALGSAGAFTAAVALFRAWMDRDASRRVSLRLRTAGNGSEVVLDLRADRLTDDAMKAILSKLKR